MDRNKIRKDILDLVDGDPCNEVDVKPIIEKHTQGLGKDEQLKVRLAVEGVIGELTQSNDVVSVSRNNITVLVGGEFGGSSWVIRSTHQREEKLETQRKQAEPSISVEGDIIGSMIGSQSFEQALISPATQIHNNTNESNPKKRSFWEIAAWVSGIIAAIITVWEFLIKRFI